MSDALVEAAIRALFGDADFISRHQIDLRERVRAALRAQGALREAPEVTDEMVERAAEAYWIEIYGRHRGAGRDKWPDDVIGQSQDLFRTGCRAALTAALAAAPQPEESRDG